MVHPTTRQLHRTWLFVLTLAYSLHFYAEYLWDQHIETWLRAHQNAWEFFGGVPAEVRLASRRTAILRHCSDADSLACRSYQDFARAWGFQFALTPTTEGLGSGLTALKRILDHEYPCPAHSLAEANRQLIAASLGRPHLRRVPLAVFAQEEKRTLQRLPRPRPELAVWAQATLHPNCMLAYEGSYYSAPYQLVRQKLDLRITPSSLEVFEGPRRVAAHARAKRPGQRRMNPDHFPPDRIASRMRAPARCRARATKVGPWCVRYVEELFRHDVLSRLKAAQGALRLGERYGRERLEAACRRAVSHDRLAYRDLREILEHGLDAAPLDEALDGQLLLHFLS